MVKKSKNSSNKKDFAFLQEIISLMEEHDVNEFQYENGDFKIELKRGTEPVTFVQPPLRIPDEGSFSQIGKVASSFNLSQTAEKKNLPETKEVKEEGIVEIKSPIVGTFYEAPAPGEEPFVKVGDRVTPDTVVCIVEAMKLMNRIKADVSGVIVEKLVKNEEAVQEGTVLFKVKKE